MENVRNVLEVELGDIPTKPMDKEYDAFYLCVKGEVDELKGYELKYRFPLIKKNLAMFVFYKLHDFCYDHYKYECYKEDINIYEENDLNEEEKGYYHITKAFLCTEFCREFRKITSISMVLCHGGKFVEVVYDPNYQLKGYKEILEQEGIKTNKTISSFEYRYK